MEKEINITLDLSKNVSIANCEDFDIYFFQVPRSENVKFSHSDFDYFLELKKILKQHKTNMREFVTILKKI